MLEAGNGKFEIFEVKPTQNGMEAYGIRCGKRNFIYLHNSSAQNESIQFISSMAPDSKGKMSIFDCETGRYADLKFALMPDKSIKIDQIQLKPKENAILIWE